MHERLKIKNKTNRTYNKGILGVFPFILFIKLQNDTQITIKQWKTMKMRWRANPLIFFVGELIHQR